MSKTLSVRLIDDNPARAEIVETGLCEAGHLLFARRESTQDPTAHMRELMTDDVVVSIDSPSRDAIEDMRRSTERQPRPIENGTTDRERRVVGTLATIEPQS